MAPSKGKSSGKSSLGVSIRKEKPKVRRKGIVSKKTSSGLKTSKNYRKVYRGQGRK
jgi:hypothetical protein